MQTFNLPIGSVYHKPNKVAYNRLMKLKANYMIEVNVLNATDQLMQIKNLYASNEFAAIQTSDGTTTTTYFACALVEAVRVKEVRQHQTKNNAQTAEVIYRVINVSKFGKALGDIRLGNEYSKVIDFIPTSNGWKPDMNERNDYIMTDYRESKYGPQGFRSYKNLLKDIAFIKDLPKTIYGKWNRNTSKEKKQESYTFNEDGTFNNFTFKKNKTIKGKFKFGRVLGGTKQGILLIPRDGKNKTIYITRGVNGMYIGKGFNAFPFIKDGTVTETTTINRDHSERKLKILNLRKRIYTKKLIGYWKQSNNKSNFDFKEGKKVFYKAKKETYNDATYDLAIEKEKLYLIIYDETLNEVLKSEVKIIKDQMKLGGKSYFKF